MHMSRIVLIIGVVLLYVLLGGIVGGIVGDHCELCSADVSRLLIGAATTGGLILATGIYRMWRKQWMNVVALAIALLPAVYISATLAQEFGLWWDRL